MDRLSDPADGRLTCYAAGCSFKKVYGGRHGLLKSDISEALAEITAHRLSNTAAPDLLEALKGLVGQGGEGDKFTVRIARAQAAIARAEGRNNNIEQDLEAELVSREMENRP